MLSGLPAAATVLHLRLSSTPFMKGFCTESMGDLLRLLLEGRLVEGLGLRLLGFSTVWGCGDSGLKHFAAQRFWTSGMLAIGIKAITTGPSKGSFSPPICAPR